MTPRTAALWTLDDLSARVALALAEDYNGQPSGRVRDVPDRRTIRYYTTLGLLDRPAEMRGRTALYGRRHLLQLVAIKRLQARGLSLAEIQERLLGLPNSRLESLAELPRNVETVNPEFVLPKEEKHDRRASFWTAAPATMENAEVAPSPDYPVVPRALQAIRLSAGVLLLVPAARAIHSDDLEAIHSAAAPLLKLLEKRRLLDPHHERGTA
jgi:DNA-binding transcriptional MerR regulator